MADSANLAAYVIFHTFNAATSSQEQVQRQKTPSLNIELAQASSTVLTNGQ